MTSFLKSAKKAAIAAAGAGVSFGVLVLMSDPARIQPEEWAQLLIGLGIAFGVYKAKNDDYKAEGEPA